MKKVLALVFLVITFIAGCSKTEDHIVENQEASLPYEEPEVIADELKVPWSVNKIDDTFYLSERSGSIVKVTDGKKERQHVEFEKKLATASEAGFLGFVLAPDFSETNQAYAYYTYEDSSGQFNRIVTLQLKDHIWREEKILLNKIPSGPVHHGGRLKIGPDGKLYASVGDAYESKIAQNLESLAGKILRMNLDGSVPRDNPFSNSYVYSYGHRNPQGITWATDGTFYASEHGKSANDEINKIQAGKNYGWPIIEGNETKEGMETPLFTSGKNTTWAPSGMAYFDGKLYVAALRGSAIFEFDLQTRKQKAVITGLGRIRDVLIQDDSLYFVSNNTDGRGSLLKGDDKLYRISLLENK